MIDKHCIETKLIGDNIRFNKLTKMTLLAITCAVGDVDYHFTRKPTSAFGVQQIKSHTKHIDRVPVVHLMAVQRFTMSWSHFIQQ